MTNRKKSAKDLAFDKEREKFRKEIHRLGDENKLLAAKVKDQNEKLQKAEEENRQMKEWVDRLLEYMDMPEKEMRKRIEFEKVGNEVFSRFSEIMEVFWRM